MGWLQATLVRFRQWTYPPAFRIPVSGPAPLAEAAQLLVSLTKEAESLRQSQQAPAAAEGAVPPGDGRAAAETPAEIGKQEAQFATALCGGCFRLERSLEQLAADEEQAGRRPGKEMRSLRRSIDSLKALLHDQGIEYRDLTGQRYDPGREDFESIGEAEVRPGLEWKIIARCERPAMFVRGQLVQPARGIVARPPREDPQPAPGTASPEATASHPTDDARG